MTKIYFPTTSSETWKQLLADPKKHWKPCYSAYETAHSWLGTDGFPKEVLSLFKMSSYPAFHEVELLLAIPEHQVPLPPRGHASQNDLFVLAKAADDRLISMTVEGKVSESFGPTLGQWRKKLTPGKATRLEFLKETLGLSGELPPTVRYQLFHRLASAVLEAERFNARYAVTVVHSFSQTDKGFSDYEEFVKLFGAEAHVGELVHLSDISGISIYSGWAHGVSKS